MSTRKLIVLVAVSIGLMLVTSYLIYFRDFKRHIEAHQPEQPAKTPPPTADILRETPEQQEAERAYSEGKDFLEKGQLKAAQKSFELLKRKYGATPTPISLLDDDLPETFGKIADIYLSRTLCSLNFETGAKNPARTIKKTIEQVLSAIKANDEISLLPLIACDVREGVPESGTDQTSRIKATQHFLGRLSDDGYAPQEMGPKDYKYIGIRKEFHVISNGARTIGLYIDSSPHAQDTYRIKAVIWGMPSQ